MESNRRTFDDALSLIDKHKSGVNCTLQRMGNNIELSGPSDAIARIQQSVQEQQLGVLEIIE